MFRFILFFILVSFLYYVIQFLIKHMFSSRKKGGRGNGPEELVQDPFCQTYIPKRSAVSKKIRGRVLYFCNQECRKKYLEKMKKKTVDK